MALLRIASMDSQVCQMCPERTSRRTVERVRVIEFGDSYEAPQEVTDTGSASEGSTKKKGRTIAITTEDIQKMRNDVKTKKNQLKQQYGNFKAEGKEILEQTFNRLQAIVSHLEFMDVEIEQDDLNQKFLTSLALGWLMYTIKKTGKKISIKGTDVAGFDKSMVECFNCHKMGHFARECRAPRSQDRGRRENYRQEENHALVANEETPIEFALMAKSSYDNEGNSQNNIDDKGYWDSGYSQHMTGNISYLSDYEPYDEGYVPFGQGGCKITGKETIKTGKLEFENVYFVKDLIYNLFSMSQIRDNKNSILFTDSECIVLGRNFKLKDDTNVLLRIPRQHNMYSIDLNNLVLHKDLTCLVAKASADMLWHKRLGHLNFKTMNRGEFRNKEMNDFCSRKWIKREFSNARTLQQNGVTERRNRTLIEAVRTMVLVNKSQNKTPYELFNGRTPAIGFLKPFVCHVMILNTLDNLGKFDAKGDEAHLESFTSNAQDACNSDAPESSGNSNPTATSTNPPADHMETLTIETPIPTVNSPVPTACLDDSLHLSSDTRLISKRVTSQDDTPSLDNILTLSNLFEDILGVTTNTGDTNGVEADLSNMENNISASPTHTFKIHKDHPTSQIIGPMDTPDELKKISDALKDPRVRPISTKWVLKNKKDESGTVIRNKARLVAQGHTQEVGINYEEVFAPVARIEAIRLFLAYASFMGFTVYQIDVKSAFLYDTIDEEVYVMQPPGFQDP
uniref:Retrovirus-related Pol polyprotein from transposon TNT 1-94 n=1 Tax=Tanacetum cinerariifolium TaxID=118510 RepID=A0A6L2J7A7_TANCI|nr:retrovirus-related Pol polyprotein from transposon TNT 1-94 [Tanacetum cinerariifolium]